MLAPTRAIMTKTCWLCLIPHHQVHWPGHRSPTLLGQALALMKTMLWSSPENSPACSLSDGCIYWTPLSPSSVPLERIEEFRGQEVAPNLECKDSSWEDLFKCKRLRSSPINSDAAGLGRGSESLSRTTAAKPKPHLTKPWGKFIALSYLRA